MTDKARSTISPVLQFILLLVPVVFSSFFLIFATVGLFLDGRDKVQWSVEAWEVSRLTALLIVGYSLLVLLLVKLKRLLPLHILALSSYLHIALSAVLVLLVFWQLGEA